MTSTRGCSRARLLDGRPAQGERELRREQLTGDAADAIRAEQPPSHLVWSRSGLALGELRPLARLLEAGLLALLGARVTREEAALFSSPRRFGSASSSAREMPWRSAPACADTPPPCIRATTSMRSSKPTASSGWLMLRCSVARGKKSTSVLPLIVVDARAGLEDHAGDGRLALAGGAVASVGGEVDRDAGDRLLAPPPRRRPPRLRRPRPRRPAGRAGRRPPRRCRPRGRRRGWRA